VDFSGAASVTNITVEDCSMEGGAGILRVDAENVEDIQAERNTHVPRPPAKHRSDAHD
jgi:hypothetical protein